MRILAVHSEGFDYTLKRKAMKKAEEVSEKQFHTDESILVAFIAIEKEDEENIEEIIEQAVENIKKMAEEIKETNIMIYPWVHLTENPGSPHIGLHALSEIDAGLKKFDLTVYRSAFGWYKAFNLKCKGHPLAERSRLISLDDATITKKTISGVMDDLTALKAEDDAKSSFYILDIDGKQTPIEEYSFKKKSNFKAFIDYEIKKDRIAKEEPPHAELMRRLDLVDYETGSDGGNFRWMPRGLIMKKALERHVENSLTGIGAMEVQTPLIYSYEHESLKKYLQRFPSRQYVVLSGKNKFFLRFAACFGQFLMASDAQISYKTLPLKMFEIASSFRREQSGEISALRRLRNFTMPDIHTMTADMEQAKEAFEEQFLLSAQMMEDIGIEYEVVFRVSTAIMSKKENQDWILSMLQKVKKSSLIEEFKVRYAYFELKFEFNFVDSQKKAAAMSTVQIDVENAERFNITYVDENNEKKLPLILHCSPSGAIEREIYAMLETAAMKERKGIKPSLPYWLSPAQVRVIPVSDKFIEKAKEFAKKLQDAEIRVELDDRDGSLGKKVREAEKKWIPHILVIGDKETEEKLAVRKRGQKESWETSLQGIIDYSNEQMEGKPRVPFTMQFLLSKQPQFR